MATSTLPRASETRNPSARLHAGGGRGRPPITAATCSSTRPGQGIVLRGQAAGSRFLASMHYRIIPTDPEKYDIQEGRWRVTTSAYLYEFRTPDNAKLWAMHWHPAGKSHATFPHLHLYTVRSDGHFVTPRQTLESAVQWCIEMGAEPQNL